MTQNTPQWLGRSVQVSDFQTSTLTFVDKVGYFPELRFQESSGRQCRGPQPQPTGPQGASVTFNRNRPVLGQHSHSPLTTVCWKGTLGQKNRPAVPACGRALTPRRGGAGTVGSHFCDVAFAPQSEASLWVWTVSPILVNSPLEPACLPATCLPSLPAPPHPVLAGTGGWPRRIPAALPLGTAHVSPITTAVTAQRCRQCVRED